MRIQKIYDPPTVEITRVVSEKGIAQAPVSVRVQLHDWEDGGELGNNPSEGGDIYLIY